MRVKLRFELHLVIDNDASTVAQFERSGGHNFLVSLHPSENRDEITARFTQLDELLPNDSLRLV